MRNYERLIKLEEVLSDPKRNKTRQEWIDLYENTYFLSARTFRHDLNQYNLALNERYNNDFGIGQTVIIDYVIKENDRYSVLKDSQGNPYTLYNPVKNLNTEDWHKLANLFAFSSHIIDDGLANRLRALIAYMRAEEDNGHGRYDEAGRVQLQDSEGHASLQGIQGRADPRAPQAPL